jgi:hypothetical protein
MSQVVQDPTAIHRGRAFFQQHGVRLGAAGVILAAGAIIMRAASADQTLWLLFLGPLILGACIPLASQESLSASINAWEQYFKRTLSKAQGREGKFARYFLRPLHAGSLKLWSVSKPIQNVHLRSGTRLAALAYFWAVMLFALVAAVYLIVAIVILIVVLAIIGWFLNKDEPSRGGGSYILTRMKGTLHKGSSTLTQQRAGRVGEQGNVYKGSSVLTEQRVGRVDKDGNVLEGGNVFTEAKVGRIDESGKILEGASVLTEQRVGRVDEDGNVLEGSSVLTEKRVGKVEKN